MSTKALAAAVAAGLGVAGCGADEAGGPAVPGGGDQAAAVTISTFAYDPDPLTVAPGTVVTFTNEDDILHTVTAGTRREPTGEFDEDLDGAGTTAEVSFDQPGVVAYFCDVHQGMDGRVVIE